MTKIQVISGFLGAGKTTWIKKVLGEALGNEKIVLIENEFGDIGIDSGFLRNAGVEIKEMNSGCICCSLVGDFEESLKLVINEHKPTHIIIEPSGVGKLSDVIKAVENVKEYCNLEVVAPITIVDAKKCKMYMKNFSEFFNNQIENASVVLLSHHDTLDSSKLDEVVKDIRAIHEDALIVTTSWDELDAAEINKVANEKNSMINSLMEEVTSSHDHDKHCCCHEHSHDDHCCCNKDEHNHNHDEHCSCHEHEHNHDHGGHCSCHEHGYHHHHADEVFDSWGVETSKKFVTTTVIELLKEMSTTENLGTVLRAKGIIEIEDGKWIEFDLVPDEVQYRGCKAAPIGQICVIGVGLMKEKIVERFMI